VTPPLIAFLAPVFLVFEVWQLVASERLLGIKRIETDDDPRDSGQPSSRIAASWSLALLAYGLWMVIMLFPGFGRAQAIALLVITALGYALRRGAPLKWILVILTFEGAIRIGMLFSLCGAMWRAIR
jgi:hypothetical protein